NQAVALHRGLDRILNAAKDDVHQLPRACLLACYPARRAWGDVTADAFDTRVWRVLMRRKLRFHHMAALAAELDRLHVLHGAICALCSDDNVSGCRDREKKGKPPDVYFSVCCEEQVPRDTGDPPPR